MKWGEAKWSEAKWGNEKCGEGKYGKVAWGEMANKHECVISRDANQADRLRTKKKDVDARVNWRFRGAESCAKL